MALTGDEEVSYTTTNCANASLGVLVCCRRACRNTNIYLCDATPLGGLEVALECEAGASVVASLSV